MQKGIRAHDVGVKGLENICQWCENNDVSYLQLVLEKSVDDFKLGNFSEEYALSLKSRLGNTKIAVLGSYINPSNPDDEGLSKDIEKFKEKIRYASVLKPIVVGTETGSYKEGLTDSEEAYQRVLQTMKEVVKEAEKYGVFVGIEGVHCFVINTPQKMRRLIDDLNSDNTRVIFDPVNYLNIDNYTEQDKMINDVFELLSDKLCTVHAKDFVVENGRMKGTIPGEGMLNYELIIKNLKAHNLDIPIISEEIDNQKAVVGFSNLEKIYQGEI